MRKLSRRQIMTFLNSKIIISVRFFNIYADENIYLEPIGKSSIAYMVLFFMKCTGAIKLYMEHII